MNRNPLTTQERGLLILIAIGLVAIGFVYTVRRPGRPPVAFEATPIRLDGVRVVSPVFLDAPSLIDVNRAGIDELTELPGIGPALAERIVAHRSEHGPFRTLDALTAVSGIGPRTVDGLREHAIAGNQ